VDQITIDTPNPDGVLLRKLHDFYDSCTQLSELDNLGSTPLLDVVKKTRQLLEGKDTELPRSERLAATLAYMHSIGASNLSYSFKVVNILLRRPRSVPSNDPERCWD
jgi:hypothetical protein